MAYALRSLISHSFRFNLRHTGEPNRRVNYFSGWSQTTISDRERKKERKRERERRERKRVARNDRWSVSDA